MYTYCCAVFATLVIGVCHGLEASQAAKAAPVATALNACTRPRSNHYIWQDWNPMQATITGSVQFNAFLITQCYCKCNVMWYVHNVMYVTIVITFVGWATSGTGYVPGLSWMLQALLELGTKPFRPAAFTIDKGKGCWQNPFGKDRSS